jgi:hypothetical protein
MFKSIKSLDNQLNDMILHGDLMQAFEKFYAENVEMIENMDSFKGKEVNRSREQEFMSAIQKMDACELLGHAISGDTTYTEWHMDVTFKNGQRSNMYQVAVRHWKDGQIVQERFYHKD